jgi:GGDEF domain-containing protein
LLLLVAIAGLLARRRRDSLLAAVSAAAVFLTLDAIRIRLSGIGPRAIDLSGLIITPLALVAAPLLLQPMVHRLELLVAAVDEDLTAIERRSPQGEVGDPFRPTEIDTLVAGEVHRARRFHRTLTVAIAAVDGWPELVRHRGEPAAHALSRQIVDLLAQCTRVVDRIVPLGGGEFALVLPETPLEGAQVPALRIREAVAAATGLSLRVGLAGFPRDALSGAALLQEAREALAYARDADLDIVDRALLHHGG